MKKKIAIIGAGIGGLTLANLLQKNSEFEFIIYEKRETLNLDEGFGIQLAVNSVSIANLGPAGGTTKSKSGPGTTNPKISEGGTDWQNLHAAIINTHK